MQTFPGHAEDNGSANITRYNIDKIENVIEQVNEVNISETKKSNIKVLLHHQLLEYTYDQYQRIFS